MRVSSEVWPVQDAKARFSELLDTCLAGGPQTISRRGVPEAVLVPMRHWEQLAVQRVTLKELLLESTGRFEIDMPTRGQAHHREVGEV